MVAYTKPQQRRKGESKRLRGERDIKKKDKILNGENEVARFAIKKR